MESLHGLDALAFVGGNVTLIVCRLLQLSPKQPATTYVPRVQNNALQNVDGLSSLTMINGALKINV